MGERGEMKYNPVPHAKETKRGRRSHQRSSTPRTGQVQCIPGRVCTVQTISDCLLFLPAHGYRLELSSPYLQFYAECLEKSLICMSSHEKRP